MYRIIPVFGLVLFLFASAAAAGQVTTTSATAAPATIVSDASGNLLLIERVAAKSIPGAAANATGLVTRIVVVTPQAGAAPATAIYQGTIGTLYTGKRALYTVLTSVQRGRAVRSLVAIDGGANGSLPPQLPSIPYTIPGSVTITISGDSRGAKDEIYVVQQPTIVRRTTTTTSTTGVAAAPVIGTRTVTIVEFDGNNFSSPHTVTVQ